jgi:hypothetical protein
MGFNSDMKVIFNVAKKNLKQHATKKERVTVTKTATLFKGGRPGSNRRPLESQSSALTN